MGKSVMFQTLRRRPEVVAKYRVLAKSPFFRDLGKDPWSAPVKVVENVSVAGFTYTRIEGARRMCGVCDCRVQKHDVSGLKQ